MLPDGIFPSPMVRNVTLLTVKEAPTLFPFCSTFLCDYKTVREFYRDAVDRCDFNATCAVGGDGGGVVGGGASGVRVSDLLTEVILLVGILMAL